MRLGDAARRSSGGANPAIGSTVGFGTFANGVATGTDFTWSEVGIMRAVPGVGDGNYLTAGDVTGPVSEPHRPFHTEPLRRRVELADVHDRSARPAAFTYQGQPFGYTTAPIITATAVAVSGSTTTNYTGHVLQADEHDAVGPQLPASPAAARTSGLPATTVDPTIANPSGGVATLTFSAGSGISVVKSAPMAPFSAQVQLAINVRGQRRRRRGRHCAARQPRDVRLVAGGIAFTTRQQIRYGRVRVGTAVGSELVDLAVPMRAEYFLSGAAGFVTNVQDTCSTNVSLSFPADTPRT